LSTNETTRGIPLIAVSAHASQREIEKGLCTGFQHYLTKPIKPAEFCKVVDDLLSNKGA